MDQYRIFFIQTSATTSKHTFKIYRTWKVLYANLQLLPTKCHVELEENCNNSVRVRTIWEIPCCECAQNRTLTGLTSSVPLCAFANTQQWHRNQSPPLPHLGGVSNIPGWNSGPSSRVSTTQSWPALCLSLTSLLQNHQCTSQLLLYWALPNLQQTLLLWSPFVSFAKSELKKRRILHESCLQDPDNNAETMGINVASETRQMLGWWERKEVMPELLWSSAWLPMLELPGRL